MHYFTVLYQSCAKFSAHPVIVIKLICRGGKCVPLETTFTCGCMDDFISQGASCLFKVATVSGASTLSISLNPHNWDHARVECQVEYGDLAVFETIAAWRPLIKGKMCFHFELIYFSKMVSRGSFRYFWIRLANYVHTFSILILH